MNWAFLPKEFNATAFKGWSIVNLWIYTGAVWGIVALVCVFGEGTAPTEWLMTWLGGLTAYSAVGAYSQKNMRETDWEYARIKAGTAKPAEVAQ